MKKTIRTIGIAALLLGAVALNGCATKKEQSTLFDLGLLRSSPATTAAPALPPLSIAQVTAPAWLDSQQMYFRLAYSNDQQPRAYATSRWSMPPAQLFVQRLKSRIGQAGGAVLSTSDGAMEVALLRIEVDDFTQVFDSPGQSRVHISMRASVLKGRTFVAQKTFMSQTPAPTPDAPGGVKAMADASDALITEMMTWLAGLPLKK